MDRSETPPPSVPPAPPSVTSAPASAGAPQPAVSAARLRRRFFSYGLLTVAALAVVAAVGAQRRGYPVKGCFTLPGAASMPLAVAPTQPTQAQGPAPVAAPTRRPRVELVFALDTTSSMNGLIEGAKRKIWSLASFVARGQPTPELRVGLIGYRDVGDAYVTRVFDLDDDLDRVYARLRQFRAEGGGDTPEHAARALSEAVNKMAWSDRAEVVKVIYLVGDAPPHTDYDDGYDLLASARAAARKGIQVHTIRCGNDPSTEASWRQVASAARGQYLTIEQDGGMAVAHTPYDAELARLHDQLSATALGYGASAARLSASVDLAAAAPAESKAERAAFMAIKGRAATGAGDLVDDLASGRARLEGLPEPELPSALRGLDRAQQHARLDGIRSERESLMRRISATAKERDAYLEKARAAAPAGLAKGFDEVARGALRKSVGDNALSGLKL